MGGRTQSTGHNEFQSLLVSFLLEEGRLVKVAFKNSPLSRVSGFSTGFHQKVGATAESDVLRGSNEQEQGAPAPLGTVLC